MIKTDIILPFGYTTDDIKNRLSSHLPIQKSEIKDIRIVKRTLKVDDSGVYYKTTVAISLPEERENGLLKIRKKVSPHEFEIFEPRAVRMSSRPVVVGCGPAGLFAALTLAEAGARPIVIERGEAVEDREKSVKGFMRDGILNPESNVQFGEGGAGTYSDGKLKVGSMDKYKMKVLSEFVSGGANEEITYSASAHLGTDKLSEIVKFIREKIISLGGEFIFSARFSGIKFNTGAVSSVSYVKDNNVYEISSENVILAIGHSARDTFKLLESYGFLMEAKGFGIGLRIEHPREYINSLVYGKHNNEYLESASYHLVTHLPNGRSVYSFCMCPGGTVVPAASEEGGIVTNGMSVYSRDADNSNAALLVSLTPKDFGADSPLAGFDLQRKIERAAYSLSSSYKAPSVSLSAFLSGREADSTEVKPSYNIGTVTASADRFMPDFVSESMRMAMHDFDAWLPGFNYPEALLTAPETRSTSPVRILRTETYEATGKRGVYPIGEGAGYSGGIVSSAVDGIRAAEALISKYVSDTATIVI